MMSATPSPWRDPFRELKLLVANKRWGQLRDWLDGAHLWVYDRPMTSEELVEALVAVLDNSAAPSIDIVAQVSRGFRETVGRQPSPAAWFGESRIPGSSTKLSSTFTSAQNV